MSAPGGLVSAPQGTAFYGSGKVWSSERREFVSQKHMDFATALHDYDPDFSLVYLPDEIRHDNPGQKPFAILSARDGERPYIVRYLDEKELDNPAEILTWIFMGDVRYNDPKEIVQRMEMREKANELLRLSREQEEAEDRIEELAAIASGGRDRKHWYRHTINDKKVTFRR